MFITYGYYEDVKGSFTNMTTLEISIADIDVVYKRVAAVERCSGTSGILLLPLLLW